MPTVSRPSAVPQLLAMAVTDSRTRRDGHRSRGHTRDPSRRPNAEPRTSRRSCVTVDAATISSGRSTLRDETQALIAKFQNDLNRLIQRDAARYVSGVSSLVTRSESRSKVWGMRSKTASDNSKEQVSRKRMQSHAGQLMNMAALTPGADVEAKSVRSWRVVDLCCARQCLDL